MTTERLSAIETSTSLGNWVMTTTVTAVLALLPVLLLLSAAWFG